MKGYIALPDGCVIGDKLFTGFTYEGAVNNPTAADILIEPTRSPNSVELTFIASDFWRVPANETDTVATAPKGFEKEVRLERGNGGQAGAL